MLEIDLRRCLEEGFEVVMANLPASVVFGVCSFVPILGQLVLVNFLAGVKAARHEGKQIEIPSLFEMEHVVDKVIVPFGVVAAGLLCVVPGTLILFGPCLVADRPGTAFDRALPGAFAFGVANPAPSIILGVAAFVLCALSVVCLVAPALVVVPTVQAAIFVAYEQHKSAVEVAAATAGVQL